MIAPVDGSTHTAAPHAAFAAFARHDAVRDFVNPVCARDGQVVLRPMMYLALSYDHRIIDGRESVSFLVRVKELLENPELLLFGKDPVKTLLEL